MSGHQAAPGERVINICFHGIGAPGRTTEPGEDAYWVAEERYAEILDEIADWPRVAVSFDDGNASDAEIGLPGLLARGLTASFFVLAGRIDTPGSLSSAELRDLVASGMTVGSHGMDHVPWPQLGASGRTRELVDARRQIADVIGADVDQAACPLGRYDRSVLGDLRRLGYARVHTSDRLAVRAGDWIQPRYSVRSSDTAATLRASILDRQSLAHRGRPLVAGVLKRLR